MTQNRPLSERPFSRVLAGDVPAGGTLRLALCPEFPIVLDHVGIVDAYDRDELDLECVIVGVCLLTRWSKFNPICGVQTTASTVVRNRGDVPRWVEVEFRGHGA